MKKLFRPIRLIIKELKLVEWLSFKQTVQYTALVLAVSMIVAIITITFDSIFYELRNILISV